MRDTSEAERTDSGTKEPYEPPAVISDDVFETLALTCNKTVANCGMPGGSAAS